MFGKKTHEQGLIELWDVTFASLVFGLWLYGDIPMLGGQTPHYCWPNVLEKKVC